MTFRQLRFVEEYLSGGNATQAAIRAGYSPKTAMTKGSYLLSLDHIKHELAVRQTTLARTCRMTAEDWQRGIIETMARAADAGQYPSVLKGYELLGRHYGYTEGNRQGAHAPESLVHALQQVAVNISVTTDKPARVEVVDADSEDVD